jgi:outer membrane receptor for ferrienterochelin and colicins
MLIKLHIRWGGIGGALVMLLALCSNVAAQPDTLGSMSALDSLLNITVNAASKYDQSIEEVPASISVITQEEIRQYGYTSIAEALSQIRDLYTSFDRNYVYLGIRGFSRPADYNNRVAILLNGSPLNENIWGSGPILELSGINIENVERIEVIRGPASSLYGSAPMLGIINIVTHTTASLDEVRVNVGGGSFGRKTTGISIGRSLPHGWDFNVGLRLGNMKGQQLYYPEYDDSSTNNGVAEFRDFQQYGGITTRLAGHGFTFQGMFSHLRIGVPTGAYAAVFNVRNFNDNQTGLLEARYDKQLRSNLELSTRISFNRLYYVSYYPVDADNSARNRDGGDGLWLTGETRLRWDTHPKNRLVTGFEYVQHLKADFFSDFIGTPFYQSSTRFSTNGLYLQDEYQISRRFVLTAGGRFDRLYRLRLAVSPRFALNFYPAKGSTVKLLFGQAFRSPNVYEYNSDDGFFTKGNPNLKSERIATFELIFDQRITEAIQFRSSLYRTTMQRLIDQVEDENDLLFQYQNVGDAKGYGASGEIMIRTESVLSAYANYSYQNMRDGLGEKLTNAPSHLAKAGLSLHFARHFRVSPEVRYQSRALTVRGTYADAFAICNLNLVFEPDFRVKSTWMNRFQLNLRVRNVLGTAYGYPGGLEHAQAVIQQDGRNFDLRLSCNLF